MITGTLLHTVSYAGTWGQHALSLEACIDKAADIGFDGVMIMAKRPHFSVLDVSPQRLGGLRDRIAKRALKHVCIAAYTNFTADSAHPDIPHLEYQIHSTAELARAGSEIGASIIRVFTGYEEPGIPFDRQWNRTAAALRELADQCAKYEVMVGVQNHHDIAADYQSLYDLVGEVNHENLRAMFDAWAPALQHVDLAAAAAKLAPVTIHTTVANYEILPRFRYVPALVNYEQLTPRTRAVGMREGFIDYATFFDALTAGGFRGTVAYEMCSLLRGGGSEENLDRHAREFIDYMREYQTRAGQAASAYR
jgi:sugar phosphate isomerase/epimerase